MLFRGAWPIEKGGSPCSFGRYGAQRHHFGAAHSIRLAPTDFRIQFALSRLMGSAHPRDPRPGRSPLATATYWQGGVALEVDEVGAYKSRTPVPGWAA